jgi:hypothetical protein
MKPTKERWLELCEAAEKEHDSKKLLQFTEEISRLIDEQDEHFKHSHSTGA